jgi:hypothetical protein
MRISTLHEAAAEEDEDDVRPRLSNTKILEEAKMPKGDEEDEQNISDEGQVMT